MAGAHIRRMRCRADLIELLHAAVAVRVSRLRSSCDLLQVESDLSGLAAFGDEQDLLALREVGAGEQWQARSTADTL